MYVNLHGVSAVFMYVSGSFGVTLWECLNREAAEPFPDLDPFTAAVKVMGEVCACLARVPCRCSCTRRACT